MSVAPFQTPIVQYQMTVAQNQMSVDPRQMPIERKICYVKLLNCQNFSYVDKVTCNGDGNDGTGYEEGGYAYFIESGEPKEEIVVRKSDTEEYDVEIE